MYFMNRMQSIMWPIIGIIAGTIASVATIMIFVPPRYSNQAALYAELNEIRFGLGSVIDSTRSVQNQVRSLSGKELTERLSQLSEKTESLEKQLASLQQIISPKNASEILTVARMKDEILARENFEKRLNSLVNDTRNKVDSIQNWLLGLFTAVIASLIGFAIVLLKRTSLLYSTVQALEVELKTQKKPNEMHADPPPAPVPNG